MTGGASIAQGKKIKTSEPRGQPVYNPSVQLCSVCVSACVRGETVHTPTVYRVGDLFSGLYLYATLLTSSRPRSSEHICPGNRDSYFFYVLTFQYANAIKNSKYFFIAQISFIVITPNIVVVVTRAFIFNCKM